MQNKNNINNISGPFQIALAWLKINLIYIQYKAPKASYSAVNCILKFLPYKPNVFSIKRLKKIHWNHQFTIDGVASVVFLSTVYLLVTYGQNICMSSHCYNKKEIKSPAQ